MGEPEVDRNNLVHDHGIIAEARPEGFRVNTLAEYLATLKLANIDSSASRQACRAVADTLGAALAGSQAPEAWGTAAALKEAASGEAVTGFGTDKRFSARDAALYNGTAAHALELDDFGGCGHSGAVVVPAALVAAELEGADGPTVLEAVIAGYETAGRVTEAVGGYRMHNDAGWHSTGTCGSFGAAAAAARILDCDVKQTANALALTGSFVGGIWSFVYDGAGSKRLHAGKAASAGVTAAYLARAGLTGPYHVFELEWGSFFSTYGVGQAAAPDALTAGPAQQLWIFRSGFKPYPACRGTHAAIEAALILKEELRVEAGELERIVIRCSTSTARQLGRYDVRNTLDAQFSLPYLVSLAVTTGRVDLDTLLPKGEESSIVRATSQKVEIQADDSLPAGTSPSVAICTARGEYKEERVDIARGAPERPLDDEELRSKFIDSASRAVRYDNAAALWGMLMGLDALSDLTELYDLGTRESG